MGFVIKLANLIQKRVEQENLAEYAPEIFENEDWKAFLEGELDSSNKTNAKSLGGHTRSINNDDDMLDDAPMDVNMEKIMARFNTYSQQVSQSSSNDDDDDELDDQNDDIDLRESQDEETEPPFDFELRNNDEPLKNEYLTSSRLRPGTPIMRVTVEMPQNLELITEFVDQSYWRQQIAADEDLAEMLLDYE